MLYDLSNALQAESFKTRCNFLYKKGGIVELNDKANRTKKQNAYLYLLFGYFGVETGNNVETVKNEYFKAAVNPDYFVRQKYDSVLKHDRTYLRSTRDLTVEEMCICIDRFKIWSAKEAGIYLPDAEDKEKVRYMELEVERNNKFL